MNYRYLYSQGPALCVYNNAEFTKEDWKGIQMINSSVKEFDPVKIGRFGLGFKSVFHITGWYKCQHQYNRISDVMVSLLASSAVDRGFEPRSVQTKDYNTGICYFSTKDAALKRKSKDQVARYQDNVSEWGDMSIRGLLFQ